MKIKAKLKALTTCSTVRASVRDKLTAVKNGDVRPIDDVIVTRPGSRLGQGIEALAMAIHPDLVLPSASSPAPSASSSAAP